MNEKSKKYISVLMLFFGSLLMGFSMGRWLAPLAAWIGPLFIMRYTRDYQRKRGYLLLLAAQILSFLIGYSNIWSFWGMALVPVLATAYGLLWTLPYLADRHLNNRLKSFVSTLVYPLAAATLEIVNNYTNPMGTWGATGFTQYGDLPIMQLASVTGMIGITFLMGWFTAVANWAWENREQRSVVVKGSIVYGAVLAAVFVFGFLRLNLAPTSENEATIRVAGITAQSLSTVYEFTAGISDPKEVEPIARSHVDMYFQATVREALAGAQLVMWPEASAPVLGPEGELDLIASAQKIAREYGIYLTLPLQVSPHDINDPFANKLLLVDPTGAVVMEHIKYGGSIIEPGRMVGDGKLQSVDTPFGVLSGVICYDLDYPAVVRQVGQNGTGLILVPSRDWFEIDPVHTHMAVFLTIENGTSLVRQTDEGLSMAVDPYGRVLAQTDFFGATDRTMVAQVPVKHVATIYSLFGSYLEWLAPIGLLLLIVRALTARRPTN